VKSQNVWNRLLGRYIPIPVPFIDGESSEWEVEEVVVIRGLQWIGLGVGVFRWVGNVRIEFRPASALKMLNLRNFRSAGFTRFNSQPGLPSFSSEAGGESLPATEFIDRVNGMIHRMAALYLP
jgi:hypothetical protein